MKINIILSEIVKRIYRNSNKVFEADIEKDKEYLYSFPNPKDNFERAYFQYKCQMKRVNWLIRFTQSGISLMLLIFTFFKYFLFNKKKTDIKKDNISIFISNGIDQGIIPDELAAEYDYIKTSSYKVPLYFGYNEKKFIGKILLRFWFAPYFVYKNIIKIGIYSYNLKKYSPKAIITYNEFSFTSSLLTEFCKYYDIENINIMHGEKLFNIRDSFVSFSRYYVWDEHYEKLLLKLRAKEKQFVISVPKSVKLELCNQKKFDLTYYLGDEDMDHLLEIKKNLDIIKNKNRTINIRFHPRYSNKNDIIRLFNGYFIEDPREVSLKKSLEKTEYTVSIYSTVLFQAYINGKKVIIDDITNPEYYKKLKKLDYIMVNKEYIKLSNYLL